jgi:adenine deaminase
MKLQEQNILRPRTPSKELVKVALGEAPADLVIANGRLVNVYTAEVLDPCQVSLKGDRIAFVGPDAGHTVGPQTEYLDVKGQTIIPGLIDGHAHLAWLVNIEAFLSRVMTGGTTTVITETMEPYPISGYQGVLDFLDSVNNQPIKILATAPAMVSISPHTKGIDSATLQKLLARPDILGIGESYWQGVLQDPDQYLPALEETLWSGKYLEGHSAGAAGKKLTAYLAAGISSCHESINSNDVLERLRQGIYAMVREGSIRRDLQEIAKLKDMKIDLRRLALVTDGVAPDDLIEIGYMEHLLQKAIDYGFDPIRAVQMATLNVAEHFGLDQWIGGIAPGKYADLVVLPDLTTIRPSYVFSNGRLLAKDGRLLIPPRAHPYTPQSRHSVHLPRPLTPVDFRIQAPRPSGQAKVRVIEQVTALVTREALRQVPIQDGAVCMDPAQDIIKVAAIARAHRPGQMFVGLLQGFHWPTGAFACSAAWDTADIIVVGADEADMALAVNRIHALQGGAVICRQGQVIEELALPVWGLVSDLSLDLLAQKATTLNRLAKEMGLPFENPLLTLITLTAAAIPYLRICESGLVNLKDGAVGGLLAE